MKSDTPRLLSVLRAGMGFPKTPAPDVRVEGESAGVPPAMAEVDLTPDVIGIPLGDLYGRDEKIREEKACISSWRRHGGLCTCAAKSW